MIVRLPLQRTCRHPNFTSFIIGSPGSKSSSEKSGFLADLKVPWQQTFSGGTCLLFPVLLRVAFRNRAPQANSPQGGPLAFVRVGETIYLVGQTAAKATGFASGVVAVLTRTCSSFSAESHARLSMASTCHRLHLRGVVTAVEVLSATHPTTWHTWEKSLSEGSRLIPEPGRGGRWKQP